MGSMCLHKRTGRFISAVLAAAALLATVCFQTAFVPGSSTRHATGNTLQGHARSHYAELQEAVGTDIGGGLEAEQNSWWLSACQSLVVGATLGLIVGSTGFASPAKAQLDRWSWADNKPAKLLSPSLLHKVKNHGGWPTIRSHS